MSKQISSLQWEDVFIFTYLILLHLHGDYINNCSAGDFLNSDWPDV